MGKLRLFKKIDIFSRIHDAEILVMIAHDRLCSGHTPRLSLDLRHKADDEIPLLKILQQILLDDRLVMPFFQILIIFLLLIAHHHFRIADQLVCIDIHLLPGISHSHQAQTDIVKLCMRRINLFRELFITDVICQYQIFIPCQTVYICTVEIFLQNLTHTDHNFIAVIAPELFIKILQSVNINRKGSQRFEFFFFHMIEIIHKTVPVEQSRQIVMIA